MTKLSVHEARRNLADAINRAAYGGERIELHRHGKGIAALVPLEDLRLLQQLEDHLDFANL